MSVRIIEESKQLAKLKTISEHHSLKANDTEFILTLHQ